MKNKVSQKIWLEEGEKKLLAWLASRDKISQSELLGRLILEAGGKSGRNGNLGKIEAGMDFLLSERKLVEQAHINSVFNRMVLFQIVKGMPPATQAELNEKWKAQCETLGIS